MSSDPKRQFDETELELIRADIAYLKQQEIDSGDWAKWEESQKQWKGFNFVRDSRERLHVIPPKGWSILRFWFSTDGDE